MDLRVGAAGVTRAIDTRRPNGPAVGDPTVRRGTVWGGAVGERWATVRPCRIGIKSTPDVPARRLLPLRIGEGGRQAGKRSRSDWASSIAVACDVQKIIYASIPRIPFYPSCLLVVHFSRAVDAAKNLPAAETSLPVHLLVYHGVY